MFIILLLLLLVFSIYLCFSFFLFCFFFIFYVGFFFFFFFFFQAEDGIRDLTVTGVQTCALPISGGIQAVSRGAVRPRRLPVLGLEVVGGEDEQPLGKQLECLQHRAGDVERRQIGRASCRERV